MRPGFGVRMGNDYTIYSVVEGTVKFESRRRVSVYAEGE
jgi:ribosomal protein L27